MKKATLLAILAILLIGLLALAACKTKEEVVEETAPVEEVIDTLAATTETMVDGVTEAAGAVTEAAEAVKK